MKELVLNSFQTDGTLANASSGITFVLFELSYCRYCQEFKPAFSRFEAYNPSEVSCVSIDCAKPENRKALSYLKNAPFHIQGFPTVVIYMNGQPCSVYTRKPSSEQEGLQEALNMARNGCRLSRR